MLFRSQITLWVHCSKLWVLSVTFQAVVKTGRCLNLAEKKKPVWILGCRDPLPLLQSAGMITGGSSCHAKNQAKGVQNLTSGCRPRTGVPSLVGKGVHLWENSLLVGLPIPLRPPLTNNESWKCLVSIVSLPTCQMSESNLRVI